MSIADELAKLDALRQSGVLTQEEFDAEKAKLLAGILPLAQSSSPQPGGAEAPQGEGWQQTAASTAIVGGAIPPTEPTATASPSVEGVPDLFPLLSPAFPVFADDGKLQFGWS